MSMFMDVVNGMSAGQAMAEEIERQRVRIAELEAQLTAVQGGPTMVEAWDDLLAAACINAGVPDSQYEAICLELTEILKGKGIEL